MTSRRFLVAGMAAALLACAVATRAEDRNESGCLFTVGAVADPQYADTDPRGNRSPREVPRRLQAAVESFNRHGVDRALCLGDFIDWDDIRYVQPLDTSRAEEPVDLKHFETLDAVWQGIRAPRHHVLGNHDWYVPDRAADGEKPARVFRKFGLVDKGYYDFEQQGFRFVMLDGNDRYMFAYPTGSKGFLDGKALLEALPRTAPNRSVWNGAISGRQLAWLREVLSDAAAKQQPVVIGCHYPVHDPVANHTLLNYAEVQAVLDAFPNVILWLNGHDHRGAYALMNEGRRTSVTT